MVGPLLGAWLWFSHLFPPFILSWWPTVAHQSCMLETLPLLSAARVTCKQAVS